MPKRHTLSRAKSLAADIKARLESSQNEGRGASVITVIKLIALLVQLLSLLNTLEKEIEQ